MGEPAKPVAPDDRGINTVGNAAAADDAKALTATATRETDAILRRYGARLALAGAGVGMPLKAGS